MQESLIRDKNVCAVTQSILLVSTLLIGAAALSLTSHTLTVKWILILLETMLQPPKWYNKQTHRASTEG